MKNNIGFLFILPWLIGFCVFKLYPFASSLYFSFTDFHLFKGISKYTVENYVDVFTNKNAKKFEIESMHIDSKNNLIFSANENKEIVDKKDAKKKTIVNDWDAIYIVKNWELASKEITAINKNN